MSKEDLIPAEGVIIDKQPNAFFKVQLDSSVNCPKCGTISTFKSSTRTAPRTPAQPGSTYDRARTYRTGQTMTHPTYGQGEVTSLIEPQKIDVLFTDRVRRLIHSRV